MKKNVLIKLGMLVGTIGLLSSCSNLNEGNGTTTTVPNQNSVIDGVEVSKDAKSLNTLQALTSISLVKEGTSLQARNNIKMSRNTNNSVTTDIEKVLPQLDLLLTSESTTSSKVEEVETLINDETFNVKETITFKNAKLEDETYTMVYNMTSFEERDDDEVEKIVKMDGYVLLSETEQYEFVSFLSEEKEHDETETERNFKISLNDRSYVFVEESFEEERGEKEREFEYTFIQNGRKELEYSIEVENERFENSIEFEVNDIEYEVEKILPEVFDNIGYKLTLADLYTDYIKRLIIKIKKPIGRNIYTRLYSNVQEQLEPEIYELSPSTKLGKFPGYNNILLTHKNLQRIVQNNEPEWRQALSKIKGVYIITDTSSGKLYIGSASGNNEGIWQRWCAYANLNNLTGGNKVFENIKTKDVNHIINNFTYAILEIFDPKTNREYILQREVYWKKVFKSVNYGMNLN